MNLSFAATGDPETVKDAIANQIAAQLGAKSSAEKALVGGALSNYVDAEIAALTRERYAPVLTVSGSVFITVAG